jgi:hypothetical protein
MLVFGVRNVGKKTSKMEWGKHVCLLVTSQNDSTFEAVICSRVRSRPKPLDFSGALKILSMPSFGGEVKYVCHVPALRHVKEPSNCSKITNC